MTDQSEAQSALGRELLPSLAFGLLACATSAAVFGLARVLYWSDPESILFATDLLVLFPLAIAASLGSFLLGRIPGLSSLCASSAVVAVAALAILPWLDNLQIPALQVGASWRARAVVGAGLLLWMGIWRLREALPGGFPRLPLELHAAGTAFACLCAYALGTSYGISPLLSMSPIVVAAGLLLLTGLPGPPTMARSLGGTVILLAILGVLAGLPGRGLPRAFEMPPASGGSAVNRDGSAVPVSAEASPASVVLVVLDTVRRDHLSLYGYARKTTPNLDRWSEHALVFDRAYATSSWTIPSHASIFTGLYPRSHGARLFRSEDGYEPAGLDDSMSTIAEIARGRSVQTAAVSSNFSYGQMLHGMDQGFDSWSARPNATTPRFDPSERLALRLLSAPFFEVFTPLHMSDSITDAAIGWLEEYREGPFFLFVNYMDVHMPTYLRGTEKIPSADEVPHEHLWAPAAFELLADESTRDATARTMVNRYDRHLEELDLQLSRLLAYLESSGLLDSTTVIITSDHGEYLGERGFAYHVIDLHKEVVEIPLIVRGPGVPIGRSARPTSLVDLFPTILTQLGIDPVPSSHGESIFEERREPIVSELYGQYSKFLLGDPYGDRFDRVVRSIRFDGFHYLQYDNGHRELYRPASDPDESRDLVATRPEVVARGEELLSRWMSEHEGAEAGGSLREGISPDEEERLRALGYLE